MKIFGSIEHDIKYKPLLTENSFFKGHIYDLEETLNKFTNSILKIDENSKIAVSRWVSPKRTRSYPYERVYNMLSFSGKKVTIIPIYKDEGADGDRDFIQWDTVSLMSLLGVYVILACYKTAEKNNRYENKITNQRVDIDYIKGQLQNLISYHSSAVSWNKEQLKLLSELTWKQLKSYEDISANLGVKMHSERNVLQRIESFKSYENGFMNYSRKLASEAQIRESITLQPKENIVPGDKSTITINDQFEGCYYFTTDEARIINGDLHLIECKHSNGDFPSLSDIKDGLLKIILYCNLNKATVNSKEYNVIPVLKMTASKKSKLGERNKIILDTLYEEAKLNKFRVDFIQGD